MIKNAKKTKKKDLKAKKKAEAAPPKKKAKKASPPAKKTNSRRKKVILKDPKDASKDGNSSANEGISITGVGAPLNAQQSALDNTTLDDKSDEKVIFSHFS